MRTASLLVIPALLAACTACTAKEAPRVDAETVEAAVEHARLEMERARPATAEPGPRNSQGRRGQ